jgi:small-conductance mechanosensitive channel
MIVLDFFINYVTSIYNLNISYMIQLTFFRRNSFKKIMMIGFLLIIAFSYSIGQGIEAGITKDKNVYQYYESLLIENEATRNTDSINKVLIQQELSHLGPNQPQKKEELDSRYLSIVKSDSVREISLKIKIDSLKRNVMGYPVNPFGDTLFMIYTKLGPYSPSIRAERAKNNIINIYKNELFAPDSLVIIDNISTMDLMYGDLVVISVSKFDACWNYLNKENLAKLYSEKIKDAIRLEKGKNWAVKLSLKFGLALVIIILTLIVLSVLNHLFGKSKKWILKNKSRYFNGITYNNYQLITPGIMLRIVFTLNLIIKWLVFITIFYFTLPAMFFIFPFTKGWATLLIDWIWSPLVGIAHASVNYLPNLITICIILLITRYVIQILRYFTNEIKSEKLQIPGFFPEWAMPTFNIIRFILYVFMFIMLFPYLPLSESPVFKGVSVFVGVLLSLGSSNIIANIISGLVITYMRPFKIGDRVRIGTIEGDVIEKSMLVTRILTIKNEEITVPNSSILTGHTINFSTIAETSGIILHTAVTIGYDAPWRDVHQQLIAAARATRGITLKVEPFVLQTSLDDFYVTYEINAYTNDSHNIVSIYSELHQNIQDKFNEAGIEIMSPHYKSIRDGNSTTIPRNYLPGNYDPPAFKIRDETDGKK